MDKLAYAEMHGRELGLKLFINGEVDGIQKTASEDVDQAHAQYVESLIDEVAYRDYQQKIAHNTGVYSALEKIATALEAEEVNAQKLYDDIQGTLQKIASSMPVAGNDSEDREMFTRMVKGASNMSSHLYNQEETQEFVSKVAEVVSQVTSAE